MFPRSLILSLILACRALFALGQSAPLSLEEALESAGKDLLQGAIRFERVAGAAYAAGYDGSNRLVGWLALSTDVTDIKGYSGAPLATLIALDLEGRIAGARVLRHSEPILLVGIPEQKLSDFVAFYQGKPAISKVVVGKSQTPGVIEVDAISGATVTALSQNRTILDTALALAVAVGLVEAVNKVPGHFVDQAELPTWKELEESGVFGRLRVSQDQMGLGTQDEAFMDIRFTLADAPHLGRALLGEGDYAWLKKRLKPGEHLLVLLADGTSSFKGSGFVRGGIFDRIGLEQGLNSLVFRDSDYFNLTQIAAVGAPTFKECAVFITKADKLDPGQPFELVFLGSRYDGKGGFSREFHEFKARHRLPSSLYKLDGPDPENGIWLQAWRNKPLELGLTIGLLLAIAAAFAARRWSTGRILRLKRLHILAMTLSLFLLGFGLHAQPSVTQVLTLVHSLFGEWRWGLFLSEPLLFLVWIFIAIVTLIWGRGVFCGWVCPYGALSELLFKLGRLLRLPEWELPHPIHTRLRFLRYLVLAILIAAFLYSPQLGEQLAEIEPFKTTFFVVPWTRGPLFLLWWIFLMAIAFFTYRPFCRYLCPLGAALALPSSLRLSGPYRRNFCEACKICTRGCEPKAIRADGSIDPRECLSCLECEANYRDESVCPPLVSINKILNKPAEARTARDLEKLEQARKNAITV